MIYQYLYMLFTYLGHTYPIQGADIQIEAYQKRIPTDPYEVP